MDPFLFKSDQMIVVVVRFRKIIDLYYVIYSRALRTKVKGTKSVEIMLPIHTCVLHKSYFKMLHPVKLAITVFCNNSGCNYYLEPA